MFKFEKLEVWRKSIAIAGSVYRASAFFPVDERFGLTNQLRRAVTSIASNLAEGSARSDADFSRFIGYAAGSLYEVVTQVAIARNQGFLSADTEEDLYRAADEISRMLTGLRNSLE